MELPIQIPPSALAALCRRYGVRRLSLFGSVLRPDFAAASDVDMLVEFEPGHSVGLFRLAALERELSDLVGRKVDLRTPNDLSPYFRDAVMHAAVEQYAA
jgi:predicted nucleotidyltransferase